MSKEDKSYADWNFVQDPKSKKWSVWNKNDVKGTLKSFDQPEIAVDYIKSYNPNPLSGMNEYQKAKYRLDNKIGDPVDAVADSNIVYSKTKMDRFKSSHLKRHEKRKSELAEISRIEKLNPNKLREDIEDLDSQILLYESKPDPTKTTLLKSLKYKRIELQKDLDSYVNMFGAGQKVKIDY